MLIVLRLRKKHGKYCGVAFVPVRNALVFGRQAGRHILFNDLTDWLRDLRPQLYREHKATR